MISSTGNNMIYLNGISRTFNNKIILRNVNLEVEKGEFIAILGSSGSGKTTLLNILGLLDKDFKGELKLSNHRILPKRDYTDFRAIHIGFIFQLYYLLPKLNIMENIMLPYQYLRDYDKEIIAERQKKLFELFGLNELENQPIETLSGGEKQRVAIARSLIHEPSILICDEPTGNLDEVNSSKVLEVLKLEQKKNKTIVVVTHSLSLANNADKIYELKGGELLRIK